MKKTLKVLLVILLVVLLVLGSYVAYVFISYHRIPDNQKLSVEGKGTVKELFPESEYEITSWNIGFAAYLQDYGFFMDGGTESRAYSKESVVENMDDISKKLASYDSDFYFLQEVDFDATRSYHVDEREIVYDKVFGDSYSHVFAQNYDSPYLMYPVFRPHGASKSGIITAAKAELGDSLRRSLPIQTDFHKLLDLDRCYSITRAKVSNGKELVLVNFHLTAYTSDPTVISNQIMMLNDELVEEYSKGNYIIAGGDFNSDLLKSSADIFGVSGEDYNWAKPFPIEKMSQDLTLYAPFDESNPVPSCRNADGPYDKETQFQITIDGFLCSNNIEVTYCNVIDNQFLNSDHNPVQMKFILH
ncbi:MAG: endonuclease/exonuclease/phosphatase family protein [Clostridia bacterium]|nr:endonuclease/exonuclease/phosphatase family protein [Clostridia bacterium]